MLDLKMIRENPGLVKEGLAKRGQDYGEKIDKLLELDKLNRELSSAADELRCQQNSANNEISSLKASGGDVSAVLDRMKKLADEIKKISSKRAAFLSQISELMLLLPNLVHKTVPVGKDETQNQELRRWGEAREFGFEAKAHWDLGKSLGIVDSERAAKLTGARFSYYKGLGARLERALINFFLDEHAKHGYTEVLTPFIANKESLTGTGQLPKFAEDMFKLEGLDYYLISTAEVSLTNYYRDEILKKEQLPIKFCGYSACFRKEAGSAGRDTRGLIRQHQFNKVELVKFVDPEKSYEELESLTKDAEHLLKLLGLPHRVVTLCAGDLGFCSAKTYDIEVWMPSYGRYVEISSCSNFETFQARRAKIRFKDDVAAKARFIHTLNGSGLAVGRTVAAILENYQNEDGSITVPEALRKYLGCDIIV